VQLVSNLSFGTMMGVPLDESTSLSKSIELALLSPRLGEAGRRLFSMLGALPAGISMTDRREILQETARVGAEIACR
jgi:hypothetical protein